MESFDRLEKVILSLCHIEDAMALVSAAGWNQCPDDWRMMIEVGSGTGFEDESGKLIASTMVLPYGDGIGWIGMVLVAPQFQGGGLATEMIDEAVAALQGEGLIPCLDATPAGERVYLTRGFRAVFTFHRWHRLGKRLDSPQAKTLSAADVEIAQSLDYVAFGASRSVLLEKVALRGAPCEVTRDCTAFALSRSGRIAHQIGPIVASDENEALELFEKMLGNLKGDIFIDIPDAHIALWARAKDLGFTRQRPFKRMILGNGKMQGPEKMFALFGPELG